MKTVIRYHTGSQINSQNLLYSSMNLTAHHSDKRDLPNMDAAGATSLLLLLLSINNSLSSDSDALLLLMSDLHSPRLLHPSLVDPCSTSGIICETINHSHRATLISLPSRHLTGTLSSAIGRLSELDELSLPDNHLSGELPQELANCRKLQTLVLRGNSLSGEIPTNFSSLTELRILDLSSNRFSGNLNFLHHLHKLEKLSLANNYFSGAIPASVTTILFHELSGNPNLIATQPLPPNPRRYMLSNRRLNKPATTTVAAPAPSPVAAPAPSPAASPARHRRNKRRRNKGRRILNWIIGFIVGSLAGIVSGMILSVLFRLLMNCIRGRYKDPTGPTVFSKLIKLPDDLAFLSKEDGVASLEVIGRGGCGEVYRTHLVSDPTKLIAVKKIVKRKVDGAEPTAEESRMLDKWMRQIRSEIRTVGQIRHRNLLPLLAHVARPDCHYLVYEFMKNGSLHDLLNSRGGDLTWPARHKIATGIVAGLEYLHHHHHPHIIHRDLKPANILLDDNMEAKIADFGLAREMPGDNTHMSTSNVAGTPGFIAPEYHQTTQFTAKCDIYSLGVILAVLVTGKMPTDGFFQDTEEISLVKWVRRVMGSTNPKVAIDPQLVEQGNDEAMLLMLKIVYFCTLDDPKERPSCTDVRYMLSQIKH